LILTVGSARVKVDEARFEGYLSKLYGGSAKLLEIKKLGEGFHNAGFLVTFKVGDENRVKRLVMRVVRGDTGWGHDYLGDRASVLLLQHRLYNSAPAGTCCRSIDVAGILGSGEVVSIGDTQEFFNLVEEVTEADGKPYVEDLFAVAQRGSLTDRDRRRCLKAADYLTALHRVKARNDVLYRRHIRDLIGHGEMIMGVIDSYPDPQTLSWVTREELAMIEVKAVEWRNRVKYLTHRLSRIHGDFHPFGNIRFREDDALMALDLSREEFGEPADDVATLAMNYIFISLWHFNDLIEPFEELLNLFFHRYLDMTGDKEILRVIAPFYAFRGLVVIHPLYYPVMENEKRRKVLNFINNVLDADAFNPDVVKEYIMTPQG